MNQTILTNNAPVFRRTQQRNVRAVLDALAEESERIKAAQPAEKGAGSQSGETFHPDHLHSYAQTQSILECRCGQTLIVQRSQY